MPIPLEPQGKSPIPLPKRMASAMTTEPPTADWLLICTEPSDEELPALKWYVPRYTQPLPTKR